MTTKHYHIIYLSDHVEDAQWSPLHQFIHPGSRSESGRKSIFCTDLNLAHHMFLSCTAKSYSGDGPKTIQLRYDIVTSILEVGIHASVLGFVDPSEYLKSAAV